MRAFTLALLLLVALQARGEPASPRALLAVFELSGIHLLCEQSGPMLLRGHDPAVQQTLQQLFSGEQFCMDLAQRVSARLDAQQLEQAHALLDSALAGRFTVAERAVGEQQDGLAEYRRRLEQQPPRGVRLELVRRLDAAAHTTDLASLLRYEVGKTQALLALRARGENLDEAQLQARTQTQAEQIRESSAAAVESFMLYAYRQMPSDQLAQYAALYENASVSQLFAASLEAVPKLFGERRDQLRQAATTR